MYYACSSWECCAPPRPQLKTDEIIPNSDMPKDAEIGSVNYQKHPGLFLKILMGNQVWLTNEGGERSPCRRVSWSLGLARASLRRLSLTRTRTTTCSKSRAPMSTSFMAPS
eukprot:7481517-Pyramimonas_sp.AAC.1